MSATPCNELLCWCFRADCGETATERRMREDIALGLPPERLLGATDAQVEADRVRRAVMAWES